MATYRVGDVLSGGYRVIDVKRGGMGVVYICHQPPDRFYAVKTVDPATASTSDPEAIEQFFKYFRDEVDLWIRVSRQARHENIVEALLYNEHEHWLFLEYVDGLSVAEASRRQPLHLRHVVDWSIGISRGMELMHSKFQLIHRDLKPQNVLISKEDMVPKISDLGIAKVLQEDQGENTIIGTKGYRAPETWRGITDFGSDVYSFGATVYAMLTGAAPKGRDNPFVPSKALDAPSTVNPRVPPELDAIVMKCLEEEPRDRYQSFEEITPLLESLGPFAGATYDDGFHHCDKHDYWTLIRDDSKVCAFCVQTELSERQLETASNVVATAAVEGTMKLPDSMLPEGAQHTQTGPTGAWDPTVPDSIPHTIPAPTTPTASAPVPPGQPISPTDSAEEKSKLLPILAAVILVIVVGLVWAATRPDPDSDGRKKIDNSSIVKKPNDSNKKSTDGSGSDQGSDDDDTATHRTCQDARCEGRQFVRDESNLGRKQEYCWSELHVKCSKCGLRAESARVFESKGCRDGDCQHTFCDPLDGEPPK